MATELNIDTIEDSVVELGTLNRRIVRRAIVSGVSTATKHSALLNALRAAGLPQLRDKHPDIPDLLLQRTYARGLAGDTAEIDLEYLPNIVTAVVANTVLFRDNTSVQTEFAESEIINGTLIPFNIRSGATLLSQGRLFKINPFRQIDVVAYTTNRPRAEVKDAVGTVNRGQWMGKPQGYWMCVKAQESRSTQTPGTNVLELSFITRVHRNWMEWDFSRDQQGRITYQPGPEIVAHLVGPYKYARINASAQANNVPTGGIIIVGQYPLANFSALFGFSSDTVTRLQ